MGTRATLRMRFRMYSGWHDLPPAYADLFARAGQADFCLGRAWFEALSATVLEDGERLGIAAIEADGSPATPLACLIGCERERDRGFLGARSFSSLSTYYTLRYAPLLAAPNDGAALVGLVEGLRARRPRCAVLHFEPLAADAASSDDLATALAAAGLVTRRYFRSSSSAAMNRCRSISGCCVTLT